MIPHELAVEEAVTPDGRALLGWCVCGFPFAAKARTARKARRVLWGKVRDHRGQAAAAGPGGQT